MSFDHAVSRNMWINFDSPPGLYAASTPTRGTSFSTRMVVLMPKEMAQAARSRVPINWSNIADRSSCPGHQGSQFIQAASASILG
ncbi:uncharacterized protein BDCG_09278 [Blastomyces dermatitidis ER-3]|uniref:Uncharacterized protein n=2 Tax=Blastomyces TaxID=229219 RepID=A0A179UZE5_BLAGS|nr:uncharacterized protein BDBG_08462 [Blastomyces gilchristii SLH14081]XP_045273639.1 uncharacterized protein BDCG_09278 [Blastomyces dermatitidis ER-3]EEQ86009.2 hypothetical protein BDCG_09278 [Blastomyces dermatitidis ER-3]OAT13213.1 hypothetical protein BDBG_08462 [Blastomyces gilchristii SLH14081]